MCASECVSMCVWMCECVCVFMWVVHYEKHCVHTPTQTSNSQWARACVSVCVCVSTLTVHHHRVVALLGADSVLQDAPVRAGIFSLHHWDGQLVLLFGDGYPVARDDRGVVLSPLLGRDRAGIRFAGELDGAVFGNEWRSGTLSGDLGSLYRLCVDRNSKRERQRKRALW